MFKRHKSVTVEANSICPLINENETQIILQRHCEHLRNYNGFSEEADIRQHVIVDCFIMDLMETFNIEDLQNTYFLFDVSKTLSGENFKRCVETTNIAMKKIGNFFDEKGLSSDHVINLSEEYGNKNRACNYDHLLEPKKIIDSSEFFKYLCEKYGDANLDFWIDFEEDQSKEGKMELNAEGQEKTVERTVRYIGALERYASYFHEKYPGCRLIIWEGTQYDVLSPFLKERIFNYGKKDVVKVDYCGGVSLLIDKNGNMTAHVNGDSLPVDVKVF